MRTFTCLCGEKLFFDNTRCVSCGRESGFCPACQQVDQQCRAGSDLPWSIKELVEEIFSLIAVKIHERLPIIPETGQIASDTENTPQRRALRWA